MAWLTFPRLIFYYILSLPILVMGGFMAFFFPIMQICEAAGWEFSNLGPIATAMWAFLFWLYVVTPLFVVTVIAKLLGRRPGRNG
jgi:hypothetical protein